jgi:hypothetical protein
VHPAICQSILLSIGVMENPQHSAKITSENRTKFEIKKFK